MPAPQTRTLSPRPAALLQYSATASGLRCAERTSNSCPIPRAVNSSMHGCIRSRSDSEPTRIPTTTSATDALPLCRACGDVCPELHPFELDLPDGGVRAIACAPHRLAGRDDVQPPPAARHELPVAQRRPCVEDGGAKLLGGRHTTDRHAGLARRRVA